MTTAASDTALAAAYQATARWFVSEQQQIWARTTLFVSVNTALLVAVQYLPPLHPAVRILLPFAGLWYAILTHLVMQRTWNYYDFLARLLREQEEALKLGPLGAFTRAKRVIDGGLGESVGGEHTIFRPLHVIFRARVLSNSTIYFFIVVYIVYLIHGSFRFIPI